MAAPADPDLAHLLSFDPLAEAERVSGKSYKHDEGTLGLGMLLNLRHAEQKRAALAEAGDTHFSSSWDEQMAVFADLGFTVLLVDQFRGRDYPDDPASPERYAVLWHPDGILGTCESYRWSGRNNAKIYYNLNIGENRDIWHATSSGHLSGDVWVGDHDVCEGLRFKIATLREVGTFLNPWAERPFLWLLTYVEPDVPSYDYKAITEARIARLPEHVQKAVA